MIRMLVLFSTTNNCKDSLIVNSDTKIYLHNSLYKTKMNLKALEVDITSKRKELDGLLNLEDAYRKNPSLGDPEEVHEVELSLLDLNYRAHSMLVDS